MNTESDDRRFWDAAADRFDEAADHGLRDPGVRAAWAARLRTWLPAGPSDVLDLGCGTGSLALLATEQGHRVVGVDRSPPMVRLAREKLFGTGARVLVGDASRAPVAADAFDTVLVRHVLWSLPDPAAALRDWTRLLRPGGRLVLVEGRWGSSQPVGITADLLAELAAPLGGSIRIEQLGHDTALWGRPVDDERYAAVVRPTLTTRGIGAGTGTDADTGPGGGSGTGTVAGAGPGSDIGSGAEAGPRPDPGAGVRARRHTEIVDVHLLLLRGEEVLLSRRAGTGYADGLLHAPSGHVEAGEDVRSAMIREAREEIGVELAPDDLEAVLVMQHAAPDGDARIGWFFLSRLSADARPVNREPDKCSEIGWYLLAALPDDMVAYCRAGLAGWLAGQRFLLHRHEPGDSIAYDPAGPGRAVPLAPAAVPGSLI